MSSDRSVTRSLVAASLATYVCLATAVVAHGSERRIAVARASTTTDTFCADLQTDISAARFHFSAWRCKPGPNIRGQQTILAWVKLTRSGGDAHLELIWLAKTEPVLDAQVIDAAIVPHYGYEPSDVRRAFRIAEVETSMRSHARTGSRSPGDFAA